MRKLAGLLISFLVFWASHPAFAVLSMELTRGVSGAIPIAVMTFPGAATAPQNVSTIIATDLQNSGRFKVTNTSAGTDHVVTGKVLDMGGNRYQVSFQLRDSVQQETGQPALQKTYTISGVTLRQLSHHISDLVYEQITGIRGIFSTKIAYVVANRSVTGGNRYYLEVADQDGYNPRSLLNSPEPIMSPSWSPNGRQLAYVSFENQRASIYLQDVGTGARRLLSQFPGINGAPAWSPDGSRLALVLSKGGSPNIYVMDIGSTRLTRLTNDFYINTEPAWSPDGQSLIFTSNKSGGPQIYQVGAYGGSATRLTFDGDYNARGSFTPDGKDVVMIHRVSGMYHIAILDLDAGTVRVLNGAAGDSASPSVAPNGTLILYDTLYGGRNVLGMVSADGRVQLRMPARNGEAQDPAWSPFLG